tara:strand:+ start:1675 stop:2229 length:555 start_codon:yes stop_codon:yes gene_type:complete
MIKTEISKIIQERNSFYPREFNGKIIEEDVIIQLLKNANFAPSHKMTQPWFFKIFCGDSKKILLEEILRLNTNFSAEKIEKLKVNYNKSSHIICTCIKLNRKILPEWEEIAATAMAVQNLWISCVDSKIGGYWSTPKYCNKMADFLHLDENEMCLGFFYLGLIDIKKPRNIKRKDINDKIEWHR